MKKFNFNKWLLTTTLFNIYLLGTLFVFVIILPLGLLVGVMEEPFDLGRILGITTIMSMALGVIFPAFIGMSRDSAKFFDIAKPLKERAEKCETIIEWENIKVDIWDFYSNHKYGKMNNRYLNEITNILEIKKNYMK